MCYINIFVLEIIAVHPERDKKHISSQHRVNTLSWREEAVIFSSYISFWTLLTFGAIFSHKRLLHKIWWYWRKVICLFGAFYFHWFSYTAFSVKPTGLDGLSCLTVIWTCLWSCCRQNSRPEASQVRLQSSTETRKSSSQVPDGALLPNNS